MHGSSSELHEVESRDWLSVDDDVPWFPAAEATCQALWSCGDPSLQELGHCACVSVVVCSVAIIGPCIKRFQVPDAMLSFKIFCKM